MMSLTRFVRLSLIILPRCVALSHPFPPLFSRTAYHASRARGPSFPPVLFTRFDFCMSCLMH